MEHTPVALGNSLSNQSRAAWIIWLVVTAIGLTIIGSIVVAPLAEGHGHPEFAAQIYKAFSFVCHQIPDRSFHLYSHQFAVCSRCTGIYAGFAIAALAYPLVYPLGDPRTPSRLWLILAAGPIAIDFALGYFDIWQNNHLSRFATGALLGSVAVFFIMPGLIELSSVIARRFSRLSS